MNNKIFGIPDALVSLSPGAQWTLSGDTLDGLEWLDESVAKPTEDEISQEITRLQSEYDALQYQRLRKPEYPPIEDYLDGIVKGDQEQVNSYIAACLAVKAKYPKPDES